jgi:crotonobetainyl-CoA:carnitine CoA-transferase CaiB-like acyl-CoA transferase
MAESLSHGPLDGIRVIDFGQFVAGPGTAMMLADQGAQVIRVERPDGPSMDSPATAVLNRGKRSVTLNLKVAAERRIAHDLVVTADVVIENFRPGTMARLGLGPEEMMRQNPRLIYLSIPGFSSQDEETATVPGWEGVIAAAMGQFTDMGLNRVLMGIEASYSPLTLASAYASVFGALSVVLALRERDRHGVGERIEVTLAGALMEGLAYNSLWVEDLPERYKSLREREIARRRAAGQPMDFTYERLQAFLDPFYRTYDCQDGRPFYVVSGSHATHAERALKVLGIWDEMLASGVPVLDPYRSTREWPPGVDCTLRAYPITEPWASRLTQRMAQVFRTRDSAEWERLFGEAGVPAAAHRTTQEWLHSAHPRDAGLLIEVKDQHYGKMIQPGPIAWLEGCPPVAGENTRTSVDAERATLIGEASNQMTRPPFAETLCSSPWLEGITILDMTNVIAGPTIAGTLARFGARVIKVDPVTPTYDPWNTIVFGVYGQMGKESILVDVKSPHGREILDRLIQEVDVVTINATSKQLPSLGLGFDELHEKNPQLILCHLDAFGGPRRGPRSDYPGYDDLVQASTGIMERFGGSLASVEEHAHFGTIDVLGGLSAAFAVSLALLRREKTGLGDVARSSLAAAGQWLQARFMYDFEGRPAFDEPRGPAAKGEGPFYRCYCAKDGWFFLAAGPKSAAQVRKVGSLREAFEKDAEGVEPALEMIFRERPIKYWQDELRPLDVAVQSLESLSAIRARSTNASANKSTIRFHGDERHPSGRSVKHIQPTAVRLLHAPVLSTRAAEKYGCSTRKIMADLGYSNPEIVAMLETHAIGEQWSEHYLPD